MSYRRSHIKPRIKKLKPKRRFYQTWFFAVALLMLMLAFGIFYGLFFFPKLQVAGITVMGNETIASDAIEAAAWPVVQRTLLKTPLFTLSSKSILVVDKNRLAEDLLHTFPRIGEVRVEKHLPRGIALRVKERKPFAAFCAQPGMCFAMDVQGVAFESLPDVPQDMTVVRNTAGVQVSLGDHMADARALAIVEKVKYALQDHFRIQVTEVLASNPLIITTSERWKLYFDPDADIDAQIEKMNALLKDRIPAEVRKTLQYIYLQYKDRAYYQ